MITVTDEPRADADGTDGDGTGPQPGAPGRGTRALGVETVVVEERGQWAVDIVVVFADGMVRRRIDTYRTRRLAEIHAQLIKRGAEREIGGGPLYG